jgi:mevalonate kinase
LTSAPSPHPRAVVVSAPGKLILAGEHAAVYGRPALVTASSARLGVHAAEVDEPGIALDLVSLGRRERVTASALRDYARRARERWHAFAAGPGPERFRALRGDDPAHLAKVAIGETLLTHGDRAEPRWSIRVESSLPVGSGMGSSAAAGAALIAAALRLLDLPAEIETIEPLLLEAERRQHGTPSGIDGAVVLRGGVQWVERTERGLVFEALPTAMALLEKLSVFDTGTPAQTTGEVVAVVRQLRGEDPAEFDRVLDRLEDATRRLRDALVANDGPALAGAIHDAQRGLERLGVVPPAVRSVVQVFEAAGGAAKISGAGALAGAGAGCLVIYHPHPISIAPGGVLREESLLPVRLGADGLRVESEP